MEEALKYLLESAPRDWISIEEYPPLLYDPELCWNILAEAFPGPATLEDYQVRILER